MNNNYTFLKIILPLLFCFIVLIVVKPGLDYYPLIFGLIIGLVNWRDHKYGLFLGVILSLVASYVSFLIAYFSIPLFINVLKPLLGEDTSAILVMTISAFVIAPLLVFIAYKFVFNYSKSKFKTFFPKNT